MMFRLILLRRVDEFRVIENWFEAPTRELVEQMALPFLKPGVEFELDEVSSNSEIVEEM